MQHIKISRKLPAIIIAVAALSCLVVGFLADHVAEGYITNLAETSLKASASSSERELNQYMKSVIGDVHALADNPYTWKAFDDFKDAWKELGDNPTAALQSIYIDQNPNPIGKKNDLDQASDGSYYSVLHGHYHPGSTNF